MCGGKEDLRDFRNHLRSCMEHLGFTARLTNPDVWIRPAIKSSGQEHYEHVLLYIDDALVVLDEAEHVIRNHIGTFLL